MPWHSASISDAVHGALSGAACDPPAHNPSTSTAAKTPGEAPIASTQCRLWDLNAKTLQAERGRMGLQPPPAAYRRAIPGNPTPDVDAAVRICRCEGCSSVVVAHGLVIVTAHQNALEAYRKLTQNSTKLFTLRPRKQATWRQGAETCTTLPWRKLSHGALHWWLFPPRGATQVLSSTARSRRRPWFASAVSAAASPPPPPRGGRR